MHDYIFKHDFSACSLVHTYTTLSELIHSLQMVHWHRQRNKPFSNHCTMFLFKPLFLFDLIKWLKFLSSDFEYFFCCCCCNCKLITFAYVTNYVFKLCKMNYKIPKLMLHTQKLFIFKYSLKEIYVYVRTWVSICFILVVNINSICKQKENELELLW